MPSRIDYFSNGNGYATQTISSLKSSTLYSNNGNGHASSSTERKHELLDKFVEAYDELQAYK